MADAIGFALFTSPAKRDGEPNLVIVGIGGEIGIEDTIRSFKEVLDGKCDDIPEQAFLYAGEIDEVRAAAAEMGSRG